MTYSSQKKRYKLTCAFESKQHRWTPCNDIVPKKLLSSFYKKKKKKVLNEQHHASQSIENKTNNRAKLTKASVQFDQSCWGCLSASSLKCVVVVGMILCLIRCFPFFLVVCFFFFCCFRFLARWDAHEIPPYLLAWLLACLLLNQGWMMHSWFKRRTFS